MKPHQATAIGLAAFGLIERIGLWFAYAPASFGDTPSYFRLAAALSDAGLSAYDASRVPGYPGLIALLGQDPKLVWLVQMALGWGISMLLFWLGRATTGRAAVGLLSGMLYNLIPGLVLFEANLLSETPTAFLVILSLTLWAVLERGAPQNAATGGSATADRATDRGRSGNRDADDGAGDDRTAGKRDPGDGAGDDLTVGERSGAGLAQDRELVLAGLLGVTSALAGTVRPLFFVLPVWLFFFVLSMPGSVRTHRMARAIAFGIGPVLILGGWLNWVNSTYGMFSPTTMTGYHLVQHTGEYFEYLPDEVAPIRDTYLKYRDERIAERGVQTNAIWDAIPEMSEASGLSFFGLSAELQRLSLRLIAQHPGLYLANVVQGWIDFWKAPVYWDRAGLESAWLGSLFAGWAVLGRGLSLVANAAFLIGSAAAALSGKLRSRLGVDRFALVAGGLIWLSSVVQTLVDHGDNPRFLVPLQAVVILLVVRAGWSWWRGAAKA